MGIRTSEYHIGHICGAFEQVHLGRSYGGIPTNTNIESHDGGNADVSTAVPHGATDALARMGSAKVDNHAQGPSQEIQPAMSPPPRIIDVRGIYMMGNQLCSYCGTYFTEAKDVARHWLEGHAMEELKEIEEGSLDMAHAIIINTPERMSMARWYKIYCPNQTTGTCKWSLERYVVRSWSLKRHLLRCPDGQGVTPSAKEVDVWIRENITLEKWRETACRGKNKFEAAIWMIHALRN